MIARLIHSLLRSSFKRYPRYIVFWLSRQGLSESVCAASTDAKDGVVNSIDRVPLASLHSLSFQAVPRVFRFSFRLPWFVTFAKVFWVCLPSSLFSKSRPTLPLPSPKLIAASSSSETSAVFSPQSVFLKSNWPKQTWPSKWLDTLFGPKYLHER